MNEDKLDHDMLVKKSLECRRYAEKATSLDERGRWVKMGDQFLARAKSLELSRLDWQPKGGFSRLRLV